MLRNICYDFLQTTNTSPPCEQENEALHASTTRDHSGAVSLELHSMTESPDEFSKRLNRARLA